MALLILGLVGCKPIDDPSLFPEFNSSNAWPEADLPAVPSNIERNLLWGDLHIHTSFSTDAYVMGVRAMPDDAYHFAKGGEIAHAAKYGIRISEPLDFAAVTDHSEYLGVVRAQEPDLPLSRRSLRDRLLNDGPLMFTYAWIRTMLGFDPKVGQVPGGDEMMSDAWQAIIDSAERHYEPGHFTTFIGYEWSSMPNKNNLHRNVIYRGSDVPSVPFSSTMSQDPEDLWTALESQRAKGMDNLAIPHNGNVSNGLMYGPSTFDGGEMDAAYSERRMRNEPVSEIYQIKGTSETHPALSPEDEFADFEIFDTLMSGRIRTAVAKGGYARDALRLGIEMGHSEGFNPYKFGVIGSTDSHNASSPVEEDNFTGKLPLLDGSAGIRLGKSVVLPLQYQLSRRWGAAGLAAVWATSNTREAIFDAMRRKETYATSGPRIAVRFFGGWNYPADLVQHEQRITLAEENGVPMGGDLPPLQSDAPSFAVWASKDPRSGNLDRIQIIKGWVDDEGRSQERIYNVALSDGRIADETSGQVPPVGNTVDVASATYTNDIGDGQLWAVWKDPDFEPEQHAFYYARVLEIPTPRWSTYDAVKLGEEPIEPTSIQERAVTSAIWYRPASMAMQH